MRNQRILFLTSDLVSTGGIELFGRTLVQAIDVALEGRVDFDVLTVNGDRVPAPEGLRGRWQSRGYDRRRLRMLWDASRKIRRGDYDLILLGHANLAPIMLTAGRTHCPVIAFVYGLEMWSPLRWMWRRGFQRADHVCFISHHSQQASLAVNPWLQRMDRRVLHLALPPEPMADSAAATNAPPREEETPTKPAAQRPAELDGPFALTIGRMLSDEGHKGHEQLIRVWPRVSQQRPDLRLVFIGDGDDRPRLEQLAQRLSVPVRFLGRVDDATRDRYLRHCTCYCMPAQGEGFGLVFLEAMRVAKPVLSGDRDAAVEIVVDGVTGRCVAPDDEDALLEGVLEVSGPQATLWGQAGQERFAQQFTFEMFVQRVDQLLREMRLCNVRPPSMPHQSSRAATAPAVQRPPATDARTPP